MITKQNLCTKRSQNFDLISLSEMHNSLHWREAMWPTFVKECGKRGEFSI